VQCGFRVVELGLALIDHRLFRGHLGLEQRGRKRDELLPRLHVRANVDENVRDAIAADLGRDDDFLPRVHRAVHRDLARELRALEWRGGNRHDGGARVSGGSVATLTVAATGASRQGCQSHGNHQRSENPSVGPASSVRVSFLHRAVVLANHQLADMISVL
jgi:hypothetical protein